MLTVMNVTVQKPRQILVLENFHDIVNNKENFM